MDVGPMINTYLVKSFPGDTASRLHGYQGAKTTLTKSKSLDLSKNVAKRNCVFFLGKSDASKSNHLADIRSTKCRGKVLLVCQNQQGDVLVVLVPE